MSVSEGGPIIQLRDVTDDDLQSFHAHQADPVAAALAGFHSREWEPFQAHWRRVLADETSVKRTILVDGVVAGNIVSFLSDGEREVGYWIDRRHWGRGIATSALVAFLRVERRRPLRATVVRHNDASRRVLEKAGFAAVGETDEELFFELIGEAPDS